MSLALDRRRIEALIERAGEKLEGDWLLLGGALVAVWLEPRRVTEDVDLVGFRGAASERLALMELAESLRLPVEAVNSAADFFLRRIRGWRREVALLKAGRRARIFRPSPTLFLLLKVSRLSEQDLADCLKLIAVSRAERFPIDVSRVLRALKALPPAKDGRLEARRRRLREALRAKALRSRRARRPSRSPRRRG